MINNLSQLKKTINNGAMFNIIKHYIKPEYTGQIRKPNKIQTNGFYSVVPEEPESPVTKANGGKGSWIAYGKASDWTFEDFTMVLILKLAYWIRLFPLSMTERKQEYILLAMPQRL